jgi:hypothetical protein
VDLAEIPREKSLAKKRGSIRLRWGGRKFLKCLWVFSGFWLNGTQTIPFH